MAGSLGILGRELGEAPSPPWLPTLGSQLELGHFEGGRLRQLENSWPHCGLGGEEGEHGEAPLALIYRLPFLTPWPASPAQVWDGIQDGTLVSVIFPHFEGLGCLQEGTLPATRPGRATRRGVSAQWAGARGGINAGDTRLDLPCLPAHPPGQGEPKPRSGGRGAIGWGPGASAAAPARPPSLELSSQLFRQAWPQDREWAARCPLSPRPEPAHPASQLPSLHHPAHL